MTQTLQYRATVQDTSRIWRRVAIFAVCWAFLATMATIVTVMADPRFIHEVWFRLTH